MQLDPCMGTWTHWQTQGKVSRQTQPSPSLALALTTHLMPEEPLLDQGALLATLQVGLMQMTAST